MKTTIEMTEQTYTKKEGTKNAYSLVCEKTETISDQNYRNIVEAAPYFRRLGGSEYMERSYTCAGYNVTRSISKSPDRYTKVVRSFRFSYN